MSPRVSIVIPVYNVESFIKQSLKSILNQTYKNFEVLIIDDGSTDGTLKIIKTFKDPRIKILRNSKNLGLIISINKGIQSARGEYIARFDGDDISDKNRIKKQVNFLDESPDYIVVGSQAQDINHHGKHLGQYIVPETDQEIRKVKYKQNFMIHPTVMMRVDVIKKVGGYRKFFKGGAEEYDLWLRLLRYGKFYNLQEKLIQRRIHSSAFTQKQKFKRVEIYALIARFINLPFIRDIGIDSLIGIVTFVLYKFWLISLLFKNRTVPPEPDDAYHYIFSASHILKMQTFEEYRLFLYSIWLNILNLITNIGYEGAFQLNFYIGTALLYIALLFLIRSLTKNRVHRVILMVFLAMFNGSGAYHGFYWVDSSFYQLITFFVLLGLIFSAHKTNKVILVIFTVLFTILHPSSLLIGFFFIFYSALIYIAQDKIQALRAFVVFILIMVVYQVYSFIGLQFPTQGQIAISPKDSLGLITKILSGNIEFPSWIVTKREYFLLLFFHPVSILGFFLCLILTWRFNKKILIVYLSLLLVTLLSLLHPFGYRTLDFLWPVTFLIFGFGTISLYQIISGYKLVLARIILIGIIISFVIVATSLNLAWTSSVNLKKNYSWDRSCPKQLSRITSDKVYFSDWDNYLGFRAYGFPVDNSEIMDEINIKYATLIVVSDFENLKNVDSESPSNNFFINNITRKTPYPKVTVPGYYWYRESVSSNRLLEFKTIIDCGYFKVQKI